MAIIFHEQDETPMSFALDATYSGVNAPQTLQHIIILGWVLLGVAMISAGLERCYKRPKLILVFTALTALMALMTFNTMALYEPYLAVRR
jgi:hypothetical protein